MTSEELRKLADSRGWRTISRVDDALRSAADEIDRLTKRVEELEDVNRGLEFTLKAEINRLKQQSIDLLGEQLEDR